MPCINLQHNKFLDIGIFVTLLFENYMFVWLVGFTCHHETTETKSYVFGSNRMHYSDRVTNIRNTNYFMHVRLLALNMLRFIRILKSRSKRCWERMPPILSV